MSFLEILFTVVTNFFLLSLIIKKEKRYRWLALFLCASLILLSVHTLIEGHRLEMFPAYSLCFLMVMVSLIIFQDLFHTGPKEETTSANLVFFFCILPLLLLMLAATWIVPLCF